MKLSIIKKWLYLACVVLLFLQRSSAQDLLGLEDALRIALQNNYAIQVAKNDAEMAKNNNRLGAAGMLPFATGNAIQDNQTVNTNQEFLNGTSNNVSGAKNSSLVANVELGWNIFDGFKMFAAKNRLEELQKAGEYRMRSNIEQTFLRVTKAYYDIMLMKQQLRSFQKTAENTANRLTIADDKFKAGKAAKTELLRAQVDLNTDKAALMRQENTLRNAKTNLNQLLARDLNTTFEVPDSISTYNTFKLEELLNKTSNQNANLNVARSNERVSLLSIREIRAERMPTIQLRSGYNYSRQQSEAGFLQYAQTNGIHYGAAATINLFNGFDVSRRLKNAQITLRQNQLIYQDSATRIQAAIQQAYNNYVLSTRLLDFEKENVKVARENFEIADEQYKVGVITSVELRDAQENLLASEIRLFTAQYDAKLNETELLRLSGELVKF
ncbi:MAG: TolC family protein [Bacteroidota bacterium]